MISVLVCSLAVAIPFVRKKGPCCELVPGSCYCDDYEFPSPFAGMHSSMRFTNWQSSESLRSISRKRCDKNSGLACTPASSSERVYSDRVCPPAASQADFRQLYSCSLTRKTTIRSLLDVAMLLCPKATRGAEFAGRCRPPGTVPLFVSYGVSVCCSPAIEPPAATCVCRTFISSKEIAFGTNATARKSCADHLLS